jgi:hypothetical protein
MINIVAVTKALSFLLGREGEYKDQRSIAA